MGYHIRHSEEVSTIIRDAEESCKSINVIVLWLAFLKTGLGHKLLSLMHLSYSQVHVNATSVECRVEELEDCLQAAKLLCKLVGPPKDTPESILYGISINSELDFNAYLLKIGIEPQEFAHALFRETIGPNTLNLDSLPRREGEIILFCLAQKSGIGQVLRTFKISLDFLLREAQDWKKLVPGEFVNLRILDVATLALGLVSSGAVVDLMKMSGISEARLKFLISDFVNDFPVESFLKREHYSLISASIEEAELFDKKIITPELLVLGMLVDQNSFLASVIHKSKISRESLLTEISSQHEETLANCLSPHLSESVTQALIVAKAKTYHPIDDNDYCHIELLKALIPYSSVLQRHEREIIDNLENEENRLSIQLCDLSVDHLVLGMIQVEVLAIKGRPSKTISIGKDVCEWCFGELSAIFLEERLSGIYGQSLIANKKVLLNLGSSSREIRKLFRDRSLLRVKQPVDSAIRYVLGIGSRLEFLLWTSTELDLYYEQRSQYQEDDNLPSTGFSLN